MQLAGLHCREKELVLDQALEQRVQRVDALQAEEAREGCENTRGAVSEVDARQRRRVQHQRQSTGFCHTPACQGPEGSLGCCC